MPSTPPPLPPHVMGLGLLSAAVVLTTPFAFCWGCGEQHYPDTAPNVGSAILGGNRGLNPPLLLAELMLAGEAGLA